MFECRTREYQIELLGPVEVIAQPVCVAGDIDIGTGIKVESNVLGLVESLAHRRLSGYLAAADLKNLVTGNVEMAQQVFLPFGVTDQHRRRYIVILVISVKRHFQRQRNSAGPKERPAQKPVHSVLM